MGTQREVRIVLVRPKDARNVGACCRAMKCMGFTSLAIVPEEPLDPEQARTLAHYATDVLENARMFPDLPSALTDAVLVAGTTRRRGKNRKYFTLFPEQLGERIAGIASGTVAVVFGNEDTGLTDEELRLCHLAVTIPASPQFPSLNLSHAVQVICYEIRRVLEESRQTPFTPIQGDALDGLVSVITRTLGGLGFFTRVGPESMTVFARDILARAGLSVNEARRIEVTFRKIAGLAGRRLRERAEGIDPHPDRS
ncbi:MAG TPA: RNA methyltransferase [Spirochaetia bacterium]|nr:RNA methyltransferase [Spirochaetia bacterium]